MKGQKGATFLEVLLVLSIILMMSYIVLPVYEGTVAQKEIEHFIDQLQLDLNWALQYADAHQKVLYFFILENSNVYYFEIEGKKILVRYYSNKIRIVHNIQQKRITIHTTGTISNNGNLKIYYNDRLVVTLYIQLYTGVIREEWY